MPSLDSVASPESSRALTLLSSGAVRDRCNRLLALGLDGELPHFTVDLDRLPAVAARVIEVTRRRYPDFAVPLRSCWRLFEAGGVDRWDMLAGARGFADVREMGRTAFDLAILAGLTGAEPGPDWIYREEVTGLPLARAEGLAVATLAMLAGGFFSAAPADPLRADAHALMRLDLAELAEGFQAGAANPLDGLAARAALLTRLGEATGLRPDLFASADEPRPGGLFDLLLDEATQGPLPASRLLDLLQDGLAPVLPGSLTLDGLGLGDTGRHPRLVTGDATTGLVPLHMRLQAIAWSLVEPLAWAGLEVCDLDGLTGLADADTAGLFLDGGVLALRDPAAAAGPHAPDAELVVEWRALSVALLDRLAAHLRADMGATADTLPIGCILEGGTAAAGRQIAREKRPDGAPALAILREGTVF
ncbi:DUF1688 family protein [Pannonibacter tanglangensis]|uniref:DUF1688 family protein n=1 Tax=Pannonibacter tanglangensis TaxID=2750084 RepID=UPI0015D46458|nr:DUF1688 family protein [Pannonibacter sp. XCT-34]